MSSIFTKIINGDIPAYKIAEDDKYFAFLDISPVAVGHALVVPKTEVDYIFDMEPDHLAGLMVFAQRVAKAIDATVPCLRVGVTVIGLEVPHTHIHLIPLHNLGSIDFKHKVPQTPEQLAETANKIRQAFQ